MDDSFFYIFILIYMGPLFLFIAYLLYHLIASFRIKIDYSNKKFDCISGLIFMKYCKLPKDRDFFKKHLYNPESILPTVLPAFDMNDYDFDGVCLSNCVFSKNTVLPKDPEFFQKLKHKSLYNCTLPVGDYNYYNFTGVYLNEIKFPKKSQLPLRHNFFRDLENIYIYIKPPKSFYKTFHLYDLSKTSLSIGKTIRVTEEQRNYILYKNGGILYPFIKEKLSYRDKIKLKFRLSTTNCYVKYIEKNKLF